MRKFFNIIAKPARGFTGAPLKVALPILALVAIVINVLLEVCGRLSLGSSLLHIYAEPLAFTANVLIILATLSLCLFFKRRFATLFFTSFIWIILGVINAILMANRGTPLSAIDFLIIREAFGIAGAYFTLVELILIAVAIILLVALIVLLFIFGPRRASVNYTRSCISFGAICAVCAVTLIPVSFSYTKSENIVSEYNANGFAYCFTRSLFVHGVERPDDEAISKKDEFMERLTGSVKDSTDSIVSPNVVVVQLESFFDVKHLISVEFSEDPIPNYTALKENGISGFLNVAHVGGGTANVEFEFLTGMNLDHFGLGEFPYTTVLKSRACETLATNLKALGYTSHALHNHTATFYGRNTVYPYLGFDTFTPLEMMSDIERNILTFCTDDVLVNEIESALDSTSAQDFVFAVSVEGHGGYPDYELQGFYTEDDVEIYGVEDTKAYYQYRFYTKLIRQMDETIGRICEMMEERGEPYVLVFYGDHLPALPITKDQLENGNIYQTEYVIKTNVDFIGTEGISDINELDRDLETYQLAAYIQRLCGMAQGEITLLHQHEFETGEMYDDILRTLTYEQLYDDEVQFAPADMKIGTRPVVFNRYELYGETLYIFGSGFNEYSKAKVNGVVRPTTFIDENTLAIDDTVLEINSFEVIQLADDGTELYTAIRKSNAIAPVLISLLNRKMAIN